MLDYGLLQLFAPYKCAFPVDSAAVVLLDLLRYGLTGLYLLMLSLVVLFGIHRWVLVYLYYKHSRNRPVCTGRFADLPRVTIQLPMYNERYVARRVIELACQVDYPPELLQIQVLDDSTDDTVEIARAAAEGMRAAGHDVVYVHRDNREGFKAGALEEGLKTATGEFVCIFDADFLPPPEILRETIHYFTDPKVCVVQSRWDHLNRDNSMLTRSQAIFLDGHFAIEHVATRLPAGATVRLTSCHGQP